MLPESLDELRNQLLAISANPNAKIKIPNLAKSIAELGALDFTFTALDVSNIARKTDELLAPDPLGPGRRELFWVGPSPKVCPTCRRPFK